MADTQTAKVTVHLPGYDPLARPEAIEGYISSLSRVAALTEDQKQHIRERRSVTPQQWSEAEQAKTRALQDRDWLARHKAGGQAERAQWVGWGITLGSRVIAQEQTP